MRTHSAGPSRKLVCSLALVALAILLAPAAAGQQRPITVEDLWAVERPGAPSLSPDGRWAAVELTTYSMEENASTSQLWLLAADGSSQRQLTTAKGRNSAPLFSPDGKWIAFLSRRAGDEQTQIYLLPVEGGEARRLTNIPTGASAHKWFPDGKRIAFLSWVWPDLATDAAQAARQKERREAKVKAYVIEQTRFRYWDTWLADGRVPHLFVVDVATGEHRDILAGSGVHVTNIQPGSGHYDISPDGAEIAFVADIGEDPGFQPNADILAVSVATGEWRNLTAENPAGDAAPRYSPDGRWLAYLAQRELNFYADRQRLVLLDRSSGQRRTLTEDWPHSAGEAVWSPDSRTIYFAAEEAARQHIWRLPAAGGAPQKLIAGGTISGVELSANGRTLAFTRTTMGTPPQVFAAAADGSGERKIESFNDARIATWQLGEVRDVSFPGFEGRPVQMWVIYPPGFDRAKKWPLLQVIHGGPHGAWMDQFHFRWNMHLFASRGFVVAAVNYHGTPGWSPEFTDSITGDYGRREMFDVEAGTDFLIREGYIDAERLAAAGGSYGGYLVAWMNGHTDRYKAYVCHAGVYNWISQMASDVVRGRDRALGGFPWEDPERQRRQSAQTYAANFKTPTLVIHGELDYRVPVTQGFEYYNTLRMLGVPSKLIYFPDENHWVLKPQNSRLWFGEFFAWLERWVGRGPTE
jgi:dipeptidyl aminopeptidase/acylaminoacyl peptidase